MKIKTDSRPEIRINKFTREITDERINERAKSMKDNMKIQMIIGCIDKAHTTQLTVLMLSRKLKIR
jgi:hypothetical protein